MAGTMSKLGALVRMDPDKAREGILDMARACKGRRYDTAEAFGVHYATFRRIVKRLDLDDELTQIELDAALADDEDEDEAPDATT